MADALAQRIAAEQLRTPFCAGELAPEQQHAQATVIEGKPCVSFASNDYLGLRGANEVRSAFADAAQRYGLGSGASHLLGGHHYQHEALQAELAEWVGRDAVALFGSGFQAALGSLGALANAQDCIALDKLSHACLLDAAKQSGALFQRFVHNDTAHAEQVLATLRHRNSRPASSESLSWLVTESVFSMDGDHAPLRELAEVARRTDAQLFLDEAHALGVHGPRGAGLAAEAQLDAKSCPILMLTFGKALGSAGAAICGSKDLIAYLHNFSRPWIYTTAMPVALAAATRTAVSLAQQAHRRERLQENIRQFKDGARAVGIALLHPGSDSPIQPIRIEKDSVLKVSLALRAAGFYVPGIRPPTVAPGAERLRVSLSALHTPAQIDGLLGALGAILAPS